MFAPILQPHDVFSTYPSVIQLPQSEYLALYDLYNATNGESWIWSPKPLDGVPWAFAPNANPCTGNWQGVTCVVVSTPPPAIYHISELQLTYHNLSGSLPSTLENLGSVFHLFDTVSLLFVVVTMVLFIISLHAIQST